MTQVAEGAGYAFCGVTRSHRRSNFRLGPVDVVLPRQGVVVLLGANGAGKSTLMHELAAHAQKSGVSVSLLPQDPRVPARPTVGDLLAYGAVARGVPRSERASRVDDALAGLNLRDVRSQRLGALSGGTLRRALIAESIVADPHLLLLDEPTNGLDIEQRRNVSEHLRELAASMLVLVSTHVVADFCRGADWVFVLDQGKQRFSGTPEAFAGVKDPDAEAWEIAYGRMISRA